MIYQDTSGTTLTRTTTTSTTLYDYYKSVLEIDYEPDPIIPQGPYGFLYYYTILAIIYFINKYKILRKSNDYKLLPEKHVRYPPD